MDYNTHYHTYPLLIESRLGQASIKTGYYTSRKVQAPHYNIIIVHKMMYVRIYVLETAQRVYFKTDF